MLILFNAPTPTGSAKPEQPYLLEVASMRAIACGLEATRLTFVPEELPSISLKLKVINEKARTK